MTASIRNNTSRDTRSILAKPFKMAAILVSASLLATSLLPVQQAAAGNHWNDRNARAFNEHRPLRRGVERRVERRVDRRNDRRVERRAIREEQRRTARKKARRAERRDDRRDMVAAGLIGLAVGAIIASSSNQNTNRNRPPQTVYHDAPRPYPYPADTGYQQRVPLDDYQRPIDLGNGGTFEDEPRVITYEETAAPEPWTQAWFEYCSNRFRSFDADSGTYLGYDNRRHFCVAK